MRFPAVPSRHAAEFRLSPYAVERLACAARVGAVTITPAAILISYAPRPVAPLQPRGMMGMDVNKRGHVVASTDGAIRRIPNVALKHAQARRRKYAGLLVTGGRPGRKHGGRHSTPQHIRHPGRKPRNKSGSHAKRRDERVSRGRRSRINARYYNQKTDWLYKMMHGLATHSMGLAPERSTIDRLLAGRNRSMSKERDLLKMGLSQVMILRIARGCLPSTACPCTK